MAANRRGPANPFSSPLVQSLPPFEECFAPTARAAARAPALDIELAALLHPVAIAPPPQQQQPLPPPSHAACL